MAPGLLDRWTPLLFCLLVLVSTHFPFPCAAINFNPNNNLGLSLEPLSDFSSTGSEISEAASPAPTVQSLSQSGDSFQDGLEYSFSQVPLGRLTRSVRRARYGSLDKKRVSALAKTLSEMVETPLPRDEFPEAAVLQSLTKSVTLKADSGTSYTVQNTVDVSRAWFYTLIADDTGKYATARFPRVQTPEVSLEEFKKGSMDRRQFVSTLPRDLRQHALKSVALGGLELPGPSGEEGAIRKFIVVDAQGGVVNSAEIFSQAMLSIRNVTVSKLTEEDRAYLATYLLYLMETLVEAPLLFPELNEHSFWVSTGGKIFTSDLFNSLLEKKAVSEDVVPAKKNIGRAVAGLLFKLWCTEAPASRKRPLEREPTPSLRRKMMRSFLEISTLKRKTPSELSVAVSETSATSEGPEEGRRLSFPTYPDIEYEKCADSEIREAIRNLVETEDVAAANQAALALFRAK